MKKDKALKIAEIVLEQVGKTKHCRKGVCIVQTRLRFNPKG